MPLSTSVSAQTTTAQLNRITGTVIECSMAAHSRLGPGLLESVYHVCLAHELRKRGVSFESNVQLPISYDGMLLDGGFRLDFLVEGEVIVELTAVERIHPVHQAQLYSYLRLRGSRVGLLINFNVVHLRDGITRIVNGL
jgi:GxxExxY protein